jgi:hypothetical protein
MQRGNVYTKKVEEDRKKTLKSNNIKYFKLALHNFFEKNETVIMFLEIHAHH